MTRRTPSGGNTPSRSRKSIARTIAYATATDDGDKPEPAPAPPEPKPEPAAPEPPKAEAKPESAPAPKPETKPEPKPEPKAEAAPAPAPPAPPPPVEDIGPIYEPLPKPKEIRHDDPDAAAPPPGLVPRGDSRSMRRGAGGSEEFVLLYRYQTFVISRAGVVGKRGVWKVVEYPTMGHASHAYAQECSRLATLGYTDFRG